MSDDLSGFVMRKKLFMNKGSGKKSQRNKQLTNK